MKATIKLLTVAGFAGLSLAACGTSKSSAVSSTSNSTSAGSTTTLPANAPVGFNAAKTEFVLPNNLGLLPASELALAKADPTYAAGLANPSEWIQMHTLLGSGMSGGAIATKSVSLWFYAGSESYTGGGVKSYAISANTEMLPFGSPKVLHSTSVKINDTALHVIRMPHTRSTSGPQLVGASALEIQAAPLGTLSVNGVGVPAICVPVPEAYVANNKVVANTNPAITAGPSTIFAATEVVSTSSTPPKGTPSFYDKGTTSCGAFH